MDNVKRLRLLLKLKHRNATIGGLTDLDQRYGYMTCMNEIVSDLIEAGVFAPFETQEARLVKQGESK